MAQTIKIKRSTGSAAPSSLSNGELAYLNNASNKKLYIGRPGGGTGDIDVIGGKDFTDKVDGIEAGATADQTAAEIRTAVDAATDSNVFTDADHSKLNAIEASADVTDATNVASAGALMLTGGTMTGDVVFGDSNKIQLGGTTTNLELYNDGSNSIISENSAGMLILRGTNLSLQSDDNDQYIQCIEDGAVTLYHQNDGNSSPKLATTTSGISVTGGIAVTGTVDGRDVAADGTKLDTIEGSADVTDATNVAAAGALMTSGGTMTGDVVLGDSNKIQLGGTTTNLELYNDGTTSYITESGTGNLEIKATDFTIKDAGGQTMMSFDADGALRLYDQSTVTPVEKLKTQTTGVYVNGTMNSTGLKLANETVTIDSIKDEDTLSSNSATALATQQSIKAYVDANTTMGNFTFSGDEISSTGSIMTLDPAADGITGKVVINGDFEVKGVTTTIDSTTVTIADNYIQLNSAQDEATPPPTTMVCGIQVDRGSEAYDSGLKWVESADEWRVSEGGITDYPLLHTNNAATQTYTLDGGSF
jgi:hypothetical protein